MTRIVPPALVGLLVLALQRATGAIAARRPRRLDGRSEAGNAGDARAGVLWLDAVRVPRPPAWLDGVLADSAIDLPARTAWSIWLLGAGAGPLLAGALAGVGAAVAALVVSVAGPAAALRALRGRGSSRYEAALAPALEDIARGLRSGAALRQSLVEAADAAPAALRSDLQRVVADTGRGEPLVAALDSWLVRRPLRGVALTVAALALGVEAGGAQARAVDGVAATMRQRARAEAEARALGAQARLSATVIAAAPVVFAALAAALDPSAAQFLFRTATGAALLAVGIALDLVGAVWMARISRIVLR